MKTQTCRQCGIPKPADEFVVNDKRRAKPYKRAICHECRTEQQRGSRGPRQKSERPRVSMSPHFETLGPEALWPKERLFFRGEFLADLEAGVWPPGLRVRDEKGREFEVCLQLRRM